MRSSTIYNKHPQYNFSLLSLLFISFVPANDPKWHIEKDVVCVCVGGPVWLPGHPSPEPLLLCSGCYLSQQEDFLYLLFLACPSDTTHTKFNAQESRGGRQACSLFFLAPLLWHSFRAGRRWTGRGEPRGEIIISLGRQFIYVHTIFHTCVAETDKCPSGFSPKGENQEATCSWLLGYFHHFMPWLCFFLLFFFGQAKVQQACKETLVLMPLLN